MAANKTLPTSVDPIAFILDVENDQRRREAFLLLEMFKECTGEPPIMWGPSIIGFGRYDYIYESGHSGTAPKSGFSPRKPSHSIYLMCGARENPDLLISLGKHKMGAGCLYVNKLADIDTVVLRELITKNHNAMTTNYS